MISPRHRLIGILLALVALPACGDDPLSVELSDLEFVTLQRGFSRQQVTLSDGQVVTYAMYVPPMGTNEKVPLILALHQATASVRYRGETLLKSLVQPGLESVKAIIVAPDSPPQSWVSEQSVSFAKAFISAAEKAWPIAPGKEAVVGFSIGGTGTWYLTGLEPSLFLAGIVIAGDPLTGDLPGLNQVPKYVIHSREDGFFDFEDVETEVLFSIEAGAPITWAPVDGLSHNQFAGYVPALTEASTWLAEILD